MSGPEGAQGQESRNEQRAADKLGNDAVDAAVGPSDQTKERHEKLSDDVDSILDDIDEVLEENAEEFVRGYVQKGGQ